MTGACARCGMWTSRLRRGLCLLCRERTALSALDTEEEPEQTCPGWPNCHCVGKLQWSSPDDPHGTFGAPGMMGG